MKLFGLKGRLIPVAIVLVCGACSSKLAPSPDTGNAGNSGGGPFATSF